MTTASRAAQIPFPRPATPTACRTSPELFTHEPGDTDRARAAAARAVCSGCPLAPTCLKWALANPEQTPTGIWAGTNPLQRRILRARLANRLGSNWVHLLTAQERARQERKAAVRTQPPSVREARILQLDRTFNGPMPTRVPPLTPQQQAANRQRLLAALTDKAA
ncbi:WhiB family transcriptional regulator [Streptomyces sp. NBC_01422]|uniref:WhiB family transcriptional regulator n=1 Tax=Streptomyces sp. NBC_01422 TaxID=2903859 RepID=UPI002E2AD613|nr:WhiB family transcriptional regulator [Streptomyces sp. NBC_01422]